MNAVVRRFGSLCTLSTPATATGALAQAPWPSKPVTLLVPFAKATVD